MDKRNFERLKNEGDIVECARCSEHSAFCWAFVDEQSENPGTTVRLGWVPGEIAHVGSASCFEWECGHCGASNVEPDSPTLAEVYTHVNLAVLENHGE